MAQFSVLLLLIPTIFHEIKGRNINITKRDYQLKMTNLECVADNNFITNFTCLIKPSRDKVGFLTMRSFIRKPLDNFTLEARHFYRQSYGRSVQYQPYYFNIDVDWCAVMRGDRVDSLAMTALLNTIGRIFDSKVIFAKCPLQGPWASENIDLDQLYEMGQLYGRLLPEGFHKFSIRLRSAENYTYDTFSWVLSVKSQRGFDLSMLNMG